MYSEKKWRNSKFAPSGLEGILIGFDPHHHSFKIWIPSSDQIHWSHHVRLLHNIFPFKESNPKLDPPNHLLFPLDKPITPPLFSPAAIDLLHQSLPDNLAHVDVPAIHDPISPLPCDDHSTADNTPSASLPPLKHHHYVLWYDKAPKKVGADISTD